MKLSNLSVGQKIPNYKKLCELLEEPVKGGNSKNAQVREFERYFAYEREKNTYIITEIFDTPKEHSDGRSKYSQLIEPILLNYLATSRYHHMHNTWNTWFQVLGLSSASLFDAKACEEARDAWQASEYAMYYFKNIAKNKMRDTLSSALLNMKKRNLIQYKEVWCIVDKDGFSHLERDGEKERIEKIRQQILDELGYESYFSIVLSPAKSKAFNDRFHEWLVKHTRWRNAFKVVDIEPVGEIYQLYATTVTAPLKKSLNKKMCRAVVSQCYQAWENTLAKGDFLWEIEDEEEFDKALAEFKELKKEHKVSSLPENFHWDAEFFVDQLMHL